MIQIADPFGFQIFVTQGRMGRAINGGILANKRAHPVQCIPCRIFIFIYDGQFVFVQGFVRIRYVAVHHIEQTIRFRHDDAVAQGMPFGGKQIHAFRYFLRSIKGVIRPVFVFHSYNIVAFQTQRIRFFRRHVNLSLGETAQLAGVVFMLVGHKDFCNLFRLIAQFFQGGNIIFDSRADINLRGLIHNHVRRFQGHARIHQDDFTAGVNQKVLQR